MNVMLLQTAWEQQEKLPAAAGVPVRKGRATHVERNIFGSTGLVWAIGSGRSVP